MSYENETRDVKIEDLKPYDSRINVVFKVVSKEEKREITSRAGGDTHTVCDVVVGDDTGIITMALWDDDIDMVEEGETAKIVNGHVNVFRSSMRLSKGKYGSLDTNVTPAIDDVNAENDRSAEEHERRQRRRDYGGGGGDRGGYGRGGDRGGYGRGGGSWNRQQGNDRPRTRW
ncbi:MAG: single-stranded DNA-binding protein [Candidatus Odinarchaeota archaeon]